MTAGENLSPQEQEIARIEQDLASKRATLEEQKRAGQISEIPTDKESLKEVVRERIESASPITLPPPSSTDDQSTPPPVTIEPPSYLSEILKGKVQDLVNIAFAKSIDDAIKQAKATQNAALLDAFHDALVDELYNYLIEQGKLEKI